MEIREVCPYSFGANTYIVASGTHALVVDPAVSVNAIVSAAGELGAQLEAILLTHGHFDHTVAVDTLRDALSIPLYIHSDDAIMLTDGKKNGYYDFYRKECVHRKADILLGDGDVIDLGNERLTVIHTPGHSLGSVCYLGDGFIVTGDTLFADTIGRCDLFGGSSAQMEVSLERLRTLDGALRIYPGHGAPSLLGSALVSAAYYF